MSSINSWSVYRSFQKAVWSLFDKKILSRFLLVLSLPLLGFIIFLFFVWSPSFSLLQNFLKQLGWFSQMILLVENQLHIHLGNFLAIILLMTIGVLISYFLVTLFISLFLIPLLLPLIIEQDFPHLKESYNTPENPIPFLFNLFSTLKWFLLYFIGILFSLPFLLIPGGQILIPLLLNSYLTKSLYPLDCLNQFTSKETFRSFTKKNATYLWQLSLLNNILIFIPGVNFLVPPLTALSFIYFCLGNIKPSSTSL